jgi:SPX domain protein involved in polyphosphate accumulation
MKFEEELEEQIITEWKEFYINYKLLSQILHPLHQIYKSEIHSENASGDNIKYKYQEKSDVTEQLLSIKEEDISNKNKSANFNLFLSIKKKFFTQLKIEVEKLDYFANEIYSNRHERRFNQIIEQLDYIKKNEEFIIFNDNLETCFKCFYRDISTFIKFIDLNIKIKQKILSKYIKYTSSFETLSDYKYILKFTNETLAKIEAQNLKLRNDAESKFSYYFHGK